MDLVRLYEIIAASRDQEFEDDLKEAEMFGESWPAVLAARRKAAEEARLRRPRLESYQLPLPGINPTLMSLRSREVRPAPLPAPLDQGTQLALFEQAAIGAVPTAASTLQAAVAEAQAAEPERGSRGTRMAAIGRWPLLLSSLGLAGLGGLGLWAGSQQDQVERERAAA